MCKQDGLLQRMNDPSCGLIDFGLLENEVFCPAVMALCSVVAPHDRLTGKGAIFEAIIMSTGPEVSKGTEHQCSSQHGHN